MTVKRVWYWLRMKVKRLWRGDDTLGICQACEWFDAWPLAWIHRTEAMTAYHPKPGQTHEDANPDLWLCGPHRQEHYEYWTEMWRDYYGGLLP